MWTSPTICAVPTHQQISELVDEVRAAQGLLERPSDQFTLCRLSEAVMAGNPLPDDFVPVAESIPPTARPLKTCGRPTKRGTPCRNSICLYEIACSVHCSQDERILASWALGALIVLHEADRRGLV